MLDETSADDSATFTKKLGKWSHRAVVWVRKAEFWVALAISHRISLALDVLSFKIMKKTVIGEVANLCRLVCGGGEEVLNLLWSLSYSDRWSDVMEHAAAKCSEAVRSALEAGINTLVVRVYASFHRRVITRLTTYPASLLWFAWGDPDKPSNPRFQLAKDLLRTPIEHLQLTARKLRAIFEPELKWMCKNNGRVPMMLFGFMRSVANTWQADTQEVEGVHNLIKLAAHAGSTTVSQRTIDATVGLRKAMGMGSVEAKRTKWSTVEERVELAIQDACNYEKEGAQILADIHMFVPPLPAVLAIEDFYERPMSSAAVRATLGPDMKWALAQSLDFHRRHKKLDLAASSRSAVVLSSFGSPDQIWIVGLTYEGNGTWLRANFVADREGHFELSNPPVTSQALSVFESYYDRTVTQGCTFELTIQPCYLGFQGIGTLLQLDPILDDDDQTNNSFVMVLNEIAPKLPRAPKIAAVAKAPAALPVLDGEPDDAAAAEDVQFEEDLLMRVMHGDLIDNGDDAAVLDPSMAAEEDAFQDLHLRQLSKHAGDGLLDLASRAAHAAGSGDAFDEALNVWPNADMDGIAKLPLIYDDPAVQVVAGHMYSTALEATLRGLILDINCGFCLGSFRAPNTRKRARSMHPGLPPLDSPPPLCCLLPSLHHDTTSDVVSFKAKRRRLLSVPLAAGYLVNGRPLDVLWHRFLGVT